MSSGNTDYDEEQPIDVFQLQRANANSNLITHNDDDNEDTATTVTLSDIAVSDVDNSYPNNQVQTSPTKLPPSTTLLPPTLSVVSPTPVFSINLQNTFIKTLRSNLFQDNPLLHNNGVAFPDKENITEDDLINFYSQLTSSVFAPYASEDNVNDISANPTQTYPHVYMPQNTPILTSELYKGIIGKYAIDYQFVEPNPYFNEKQYILGTNETGYFSFHHFNYSTNMVIFTKMFMGKNSRISYNIPNQIFTDTKTGIQEFMKSTDVGDWKLSAKHTDSMNKIFINNQVKNDFINKIHQVFVKLERLILKNKPK